MEAKVRWIASYPKSGNTWIRLWLESYNSQQPPSMRGTQLSGIPQKVRWFQRVSSVPFSDLDWMEQTMLWPAALFNGLSEYETDLILKTHLPCAIMAGIQLIPWPLSRRALYVVRDPRDVAISWAHHNGFTIDEAITQLNYREANIKGDDGIVQLIGDWSSHVLSWVDRPKRFPVTVVRYEDLDESWPEVVAAITDLEFDEERAAYATEQTQFKRLQDREKKEGFGEATHGLFFRSGQVGAWQDVLTPEQVQRIVSQHGEVMKRFNYRS